VKLKRASINPFLLEENLESISNMAPPAVLMVSYPSLAQQLVVTSYDIGGEH